MNENIKELAKQSGIEIYGLGKDRTKWENSLEKFAELIVEDCLELCTDSDTYIDISEHFGIEDEE